MEVKWQGKPGRPRRIPVVPQVKQRCPHCGSENHVFQNSEIREGARWVRRRCRNCRGGFIVSENDSGNQKESQQSG
jgi:transposase-like protein